MKIISKVLSNSTIIKLVDRDARTPEEVAELRQKGIKVLSKRHIESYLLDDEILQLLCNKEGKSDEYQKIVEIKEQKLASSISRGNAADDIKSASGEIFVEIKRNLQLNRGGNTKDAFFRDIMAPLITPETNVYQDLKHEIFG